MRIVLVIGALSYGGAEKVICTLANYFSSRGNLVFLISIRKSEIPFDIDSAVTVVNGLGGSNKINEIMLLRRKIKQFEPNIVLSFLTQINIATRISITGLGIPLAVSERSNPKLFPKNRLLRLLRNIVYLKCDGFIFQTNDSKNSFSKRIIKKSVVIENPLTINIASQPLDDRKNRIVSVGRLIKNKNHELLIHSFSDITKKYPDYTVEIYGSGPEKDRLQCLINQLNLMSKIRIIDAKPNIIMEIKTAKIFVLTSNNEGMPNALIEAMAMGLACVSTDCPIGGPAQLIQDSENGLLISVDSRLELTNALEKIVENNDFRKKMSLNALNIREKNDVKKIGEEWLEYLKKLSIKN